MFEQPKTPGQSEAAEEDRRSITVEIDTQGDESSSKWDVFYISKYKVRCFSYCDEWILCTNLVDFVVTDF